MRAWLINNHARNGCRGRKEDGGNIFLRNVGIYTQVQTASRPKRATECKHIHDVTEHMTHTKPADKFTNLTQQSVLWDNGY
jgi:hypothetical protein